MSISKIELDAIASQLKKISTEEMHTEAVDKSSEVKPALSKVEFSEDAKIFMEALDAIKNTPDINLEKVAELKAAIANGTYKVDSLELASKMFSAHLEQH